MDKKVISCAFNIDTACVEVKFADGSVIAIDCTLVEAEVARNMYESSEMEWLVNNAPVDYVNLLLYGDVREYLRNVPEYHPFVDFKGVVNELKNAGYDGILCVELDYQPVCNYRSAQISREYLHNVLGF